MPKRHVLTLQETFQQKLNQLNRIGVSKKETCRQLGVRNSPFIHSASSFAQYSYLCAGYAEYCLSRDPTARTIRYCLAKGFAYDFVQSKIDAGQSASTVARLTSALAKLHGKNCTEIHDNRPAKRYRDFTRSRGYTEISYAADAARDDKRGEDARFARCVGVREVELTHLRGNCLSRDTEGRLRLHITRDTCYTLSDSGRKTCAAKGGRKRHVLIAPENEEYVIWYVKRAGAEELICNTVSDKLDVHGIRAIFAADEYRRVSKDIDSIRGERVSNQKNPSKTVSRVYKTRDGKKREFDRMALRYVSKQLGHNRESVCVESYLRNI